MSPGSNTYIVFGEAKVQELNFPRFTNIESLKPHSAYQPPPVKQVNAIEEESGEEENEVSISLQKLIRFLGRSWRHRRKGR